MKNSGLRSKRKSSLRSLRALTGMESLEDRRVLAANILASGASAVAASATQDVTMTVALSDATANAEAVLAIDVSAASGSTVDPAAVTILDSSGNSVAASFSSANANGTSSQAIVSLPAGVYTLQISGENTSAGAYEVGVSLLGDVNAGDDTVGAVSAAELTSARSAFAQTFGTGNFVTDLFNKVHGLTGTGSFETGFDTNGDGALDSSDLAVIQQNAELGTVNVSLQFDSDAPTLGNIRLVSDTGASGADGITSNANMLVDVTDASQITSVTASINGGTAVDVSSLVGDFNTTGSFLLESTDLTAINGGTALSDGPITISFIATDELGNVSAPVTFSLTLITNNTAPTTTGISDRTTAEDTAFSLNASASFSDTNNGDVLTYSATGLPAWLSLDSTTGILSGTPANANVGTSTINVTALDSQSASVSDSFVLTVTNVNDAPVLTTAIGRQAADEDDPFSLDLSNFFSDPDGDTITYSAVQATGFDSNGNVINGSQLPAWLTLTNGVLSGTPGDGDIGTFTVGVTAVDPSGATENELFTVNVTNLNDAPTLATAIADQSGSEDAGFNLNLNSTFADADAGDTLTLTATGLPAGITINGGVISGTPGDAAVGTHNVTVTATDSFGASISDTFVLTIANVNDVPVVSDANASVDPAAANGTSVVTVVATDDDTSDTRAFAITNGNTNGQFAINATTGEVAVADTTQLVDGSTTILTVTVTDGANASDTATVTIQITSNFDPTAVNDSGFSVNDTDTLSITGASLVSNDTDPDSDTLSVSAVNATSSQGASVTLAGSTITYDPSASATLAALGTGESLTDTFTYTVSDGNGGTDTATVSVVVNGVDLVKYRVEVLDGSGNVATSIAPGAAFTVVAYAEDLRTDPGGVFAAFLDVDYAGVAVTTNGAINRASSGFTQATNGTNATAGVLDEVGGLSPSFSPTGSGEKEVFRQAFTAGSASGTLTLTGNQPEDQSQRQTLLYGVNDGVDVNQIDFGSTTLTIGTSSSAAGAVFNPNDVNGDGFVSPMDALFVVNVLNGSSAGRAGADVNGDGAVSPMDVLLVINNLFLGSAGGDDVLVGNHSDVSEDSLANALEFVFEELATDIAADPQQTAAMLTELDSPLVDSIYKVVNADESEQEGLWDQLADDLAALLTDG